MERLRLCIWGLCFRKRIFRDGFLADRKRCEAIMRIMTGRRKIKNEREILKLHTKVLEFEKIMNI